VNIHGTHLLLLLITAASMINAYAAKMVYKPLDKNKDQTDEDQKRAGADD
jgi:hypothetical protein